MRLGREVLHKDDVWTKEYIKACHKGLADYRNKLEDRLKDIEDTIEFMKTGNQIYLVKSRDDQYSYIDAQRNFYQYENVHGVPTLIDANFNRFEIIEWCEMPEKEIREYSITVSRVHYIMKTRPIGGQKNE